MDAKESSCSWNLKKKINLCFFSFFFLFICLFISCMAKAELVELGEFTKGSSSDR
jgi:hypothetical protein